LERHLGKGLRLGWRGVLARGSAQAATSALSVIFGEYAMETKVAAKKRLNVLPKDRRAREALRFAEEIRKSGANWTEAHNRLFGPGGKISRLFTTELERVAFTRTREYKEIHAIIDDLPKPDVEASGKILVRVPKSVHAALLAEASEEGTS